MSTTVYDSLLFKNMFNTKEMAHIFSDKNLIQKYIDTEIALAKAEADCGVIRYSPMSRPKNHKIKIELGL